MANTLLKFAERQCPVAGIFAVTLANFVAASNVVRIALPVGAIVTGGHLLVKTVANTTGTDALTIGDSGSANRYLASTTLKTAARTALTLTGFTHTTQLELLLTRTPADTAATTLDIEVVVEYLTADRVGQYQG